MSIETATEARDQARAELRQAEQNEGDLLGRRKRLLELVNASNDLTVVTKTQTELADLERQLQALRPVLKRRRETLATAETSLQHERTRWSQPAVDRTRLERELNNAEILQRQAAGSVATARANLRQAESRAADADSEVQRLRALLEQD